MSDWLQMDPGGVRQQGDSFHTASQSLSEAAGSWGNMLAENDLGREYQQHAKAIVAGFGHVTEAVKSWSDACAAFGDALTHAANSADYTDQQFSGEIGKVGFDDKGDLTMNGKQP